MLIIIGEKNAGKKLMLPAGDAGPILAALTNAKLVDEAWDSKLTLLDEELHIAVVQDDALAPIPDPISAMSEELKKTSARWLDEYASHQTTKKELEALKKSLEERGIKLEEPKQEDSHD